MKKLIETVHLYPPIPIRDFDWCATLVGYEPGDPQGWGKTEEAAIDDLLSECAAEEESKYD
jgi:hypothetical protein